MRRIIVGNDQGGKSDVLAVDDLSTLPHLGFNIFGRDLWITHETPADLSSSRDPTLNAPVRHEPPDGGTIFRIVRFAPSAQPLSAADVEAMHRSIQSVHVPSKDEMAAAKHSSMHKTDTLNYFMIASGRVWMLTEGQDVLLQAGDVIVQNGGMHGWRNDGPDECVLVGVLVDGRAAA
ncbi:MULTISPECIES: cupin domain-containing protein [Bradyrhizobium]|uniref:cupin domain-containing protein n=1 Tax=Bradyrhizobium TaxID=374 RepID=UPI00067BBAE9|nr:MULTISPECIES: cupin domain-containing protein [Bradyrhizobium]MDH2380737.1 cupin domain-containing protein [Bradyrhizobium sp. CER78]